MKKLLIKIGLYLTVGLLVFGLFKSNQNLRNAKNRLSDNQATIVNYRDSIDAFKINDSINVVRIHSLNLDKQELEKLNIDNKDIIEDLGIDLKRVKQLNTTLTQTINNFKPIVSDTLIITEFADTINCKNISYADDWFKMDGVICDDSGLDKIRTENKESLVYIENVIPKKFLFIK